MQNKILYIVVILILISVLFVLFLNLKPRTQDKEQRTTTTYSIGITHQLYKQGKDSITTTKKTFHNAVTLKPSAVDSSYKYAITPGSTWFYQGGDSSYKLSLNILASADSNLSLEYFLNINSKYLVRIDTIFLSRIDTLKIKDTITIKQDPPFYNTFIFGTIVTGSIILLLINFLK